MHSSHRFLPYFSRLDDRPRGGAPAPRGCDAGDRQRPGARDAPRSAAAGSRIPCAGPAGRRRGDGRCHRSNHHSRSSLQRCDGHDRSEMPARDRGGGGRDGVRDAVARRLPPQRLAGVVARPAPQLLGAVPRTARPRCGEAQRSGGDPARHGPPRPGPGHAAVPLACRCGSRTVCSCTGYRGCSTGAAGCAPGAQLSWDGLSRLYPLNGSAEPLAPGMTLHLRQDFHERNTWSSLRLRVVDQPAAAPAILPGLTPDVAEWLDDGSFARWVLSRVSDPPSTLDWLCRRLDRGLASDLHLALGEVHGPSQSRHRGHIRA